MPRDFSCCSLCSIFSCDCGPETPCKQPDENVFSHVDMTTGFRVSKDKLKDEKFEDAEIAMRKLAKELNDIMNS